MLCKVTLAPLIELLLLFVLPQQAGDYLLSSRHSVNQKRQEFTYHREDVVSGLSHIPDKPLACHFFTPFLFLASSFNNFDKPLLNLANAVLKSGSSSPAPVM